MNYVYNVLVYIFQVDYVIINSEDLIMVGIYFVDVFYNLRNNVKQNQELVGSCFWIRFVLFVYIGIILICLLKMQLLINNIRIFLRLLLFEKLNN